VCLRAGHAVGGSPTDCRRILRNPALVVDTTEVSGSDAQSDFWEATVRWVIAHSSAITDEQCEIMLSWAIYEYTGADLRSLVLTGKKEGEL
jgi:hypothetical protein